jgi:3D (Asp-Asp-Asp) domain-containing protein
MRSSILDRAGMFGSILVISAASSLAACGGGSNGSGAEPGTTEADEITVHPGHGQTSTGEAITNGDTTNPYDSTDDPSDPSYVPTASPKLESGDSETGSSAEALSTTTATSFALTYYVVSLRPKSDPSQVTIRDCAGNFLTSASYAWRDDAVMQGTARFTASDGTSKTINAGSGCWVSLPYSQRWGLGVSNPATGKAFELRPFRSIAVDPTVLKVGSWYYVKELDGVQMPYPASTMKHDGCVRAVDVGPAIKGRHIDFFSGYYSAYQALIGGSSTMGGKESISLYSGTTKCATHIANGY